MYDLGYKKDNAVELLGVDWASGMKIRKGNGFEDSSMPVSLDSRMHGPRSDPALLASGQAACAARLQPA